MIFANDGTFPAELAEVARIGFTWEDDDDDPGETVGIDFEPYDDFWAPEETADWFQSWTGNPAAHGEEFRVFGQSGDGGHAAFWLIRPNAPLEDQPVVFLGSEGDAGVVARDLGAFLWLLAEGVGPLEAIETSETKKPGSDDEFRLLAEEYAPGRQSPAGEIVAAAQREFPGFVAMLDDLCR